MSNGIKDQFDQVTALKQISGQKIGFEEEEPR